MEPFGTAKTATVGALGFDCDVPLSPTDVMAFANAGFTWCARYLSRGEESARDLQAVEVRAIHTVGMAVALVQHVAPAGWTASPGLGSVLGQEAAHNAAGIGCPPGVVLWLDLEGVSSSCPASAVVGFCNAWTTAAEGAGYGTGLYVGANCGLTGSQLYRDLSVRAYWRSLSRSAPVVERRGFQIVQSFGGVLNDVSYDRDVMARDALGGVPTWWAP